MRLRLDGQLPRPLQSLALQKKILFIRCEPCYRFDGPNQRWMERCRLYILDPSVYIVHFNHPPPPISRKLFFSIFLFLPSLSIPFFLPYLLLLVSFILSPFYLTQNWILLNSNLNNLSNYVPT